MWWRILGEQDLPRGKEEPVPPVPLDRVNTVVVAAVGLDFWQPLSPSTRSSFELFFARSLVGALVVAAVPSPLLPAPPLERQEGLAVGLLLLSLSIGAADLVLVLAVAVVVLLVVVAVVVVYKLLFALLVVLLPLAVVLGVVPLLVLVLLVGLRPPTGLTALGLVVPVLLAHLINTPPPPPPLATP